MTSHVKVVETRPHVALNCYPPTTPTGLGTCCRTLLKLLPGLELMAYPHPHHQKGMRLPSAAEWDEEMATSIRTVVAVERPLPANLFARARERRVKTVLVVMHEWLNRDCEWFADTDVFVCPNQAAVTKCNDLGIPESKVVHLPFPLDLESLPFTLRTRADRFVFSNGWGGVNDRKGWPSMRAALELMTPEERGRVSVRSQKPIDWPHGWPIPNSPMVASKEADGTRHYDGQDIAVVPSYYEGLGLSILEPMALGLPVLTTMAPPMSEYLVDAYGDLAGHVCLQVKEMKKVKVWNHPVESWYPWPEAIVRAVREMSAGWVTETDMVQELSRRGRAYAERISSPQVLAQWGEVLGC